MTLDSKQVTKIIISTIIAGHLLLAFLAIAAHAHEAHTGQHYDPECCSGHDCAPATRVVLNPDGSRTITNENGQTAIFPMSMKHRPSTDGKLHACISQYTGKPLCIYANEGM